MAEKSQLPTKQSEQARTPEPTFQTTDMLALIADTQIDQAKLHDYRNPDKTEPQKLSAVIVRMQASMLWRIKQQLGQTVAAQAVPEGMDIWGEVAAIGTATGYILEVKAGKLKPGEKTHPFTDSAWDLPPEEVEKYAKGVKDELKNASEFLDQANPVLSHLPETEEEMTNFLRALCYLKVKPLIEEGV